MPTPIGATPAPADKAEVEKVQPLSDLELTWVRNVLTKFYHNEQPPAPPPDPTKPATPAT